MSIKSIFTVGGGDQPLLSQLINQETKAFKFLQKKGISTVGVLVAMSGRSYRDIVDSAPSPVIQAWCFWVREQAIAAVLRMREVSHTSGPSEIAEGVEVHADSTEQAFCRLPLAPETAVVSSTRTIPPVPFELLRLYLAARARLSIAFSGSNIAFSVENSVEAAASTVEEVLEACKNLSTNGHQVGRRVLVCKPGSEETCGLVPLDVPYEVYSVALAELVSAQTTIYRGVHV
jgi:hypothetical protein